MTRRELVGKRLPDQTRPSPYELHVKRWSGCTACLLHQCRHRVVLARGTLPCDVLFVGEAPGVSEDVLGRPFVGPAGQLLDVIVKRSVPLSLRVAFTNLVCCLPVGEDGVKVEEPPDEAVMACQERLVEFIDVADPRLIVCVGALSRDFFDPDYRHRVRLRRPVSHVDIKHPAAILREPVVNKGLSVQRCCVVVANAVSDFVMVGGVM